MEKNNVNKKLFKTLKHYFINELSLKSTVVVGTGPNQFFVRDIDPIPIREVRERGQIMPTTVCDIPTALHCCKISFLLLGRLGKKCQQLFNRCALFHFHEYRHA